MTTREDPPYVAVRSLAGIALLVCGVSALMFWQLWTAYWFQSHDMHAYPMRVVEYVRGWRGGFIFPRWAPDLYGGYGSPLFNYYAPGLTIAAGLFHVFGINPALALKIVLILATGFGGASVWGFIYRETRRHDAAWLAMVGWLFMPYRYVTLVFVRGDLAEYAAFCLVPAAIWSMRELSRLPRARLPRAMLLTALLSGAVVCTHTLTGLWTAELLVLFVVPQLVRAVREKDHDRVLAIVGAYGGGMGLSSVYAVPALLERPHVHLERMVTALRPTVQSLVTLDWFVKPSFYYVGALVLGSLATGLALSLVRGRKREERALVFTFFLTLVLLVIEHPIAAPLWSYIPFADVMKFPWRLLGFVALSGAALLAMCWRVLVPERPYAWLLLVVVAAGLIYDSQREFPKFYAMSSKEVPSTPTEIANGIHSTIVFEEYLPIQVERPPAVPRRQYVIPDQGVHVLSSLQSGNGYKVEVEADRPTLFELTNYWFPGWYVVTDSGPKPATIHQAKNGMIEIRLPEAGTYRLRVRFGSTWPRMLGAGLTWITVGGLLLVAWWTSRKKA